MTDKLLQLRVGVRLIPMVNSWYATALLVSPLTFGLVTRRSHLPLLASYLEAPEVHLQCVATPELRGGPFVDYAGDTAAVEALVEHTETRCAGSLALAEAVAHVCASLDSRATGASLRSLYDDVDPMLRGSVEFHYDANKRAGVRFFEGDLYNKLPAHASLQSCRLEWVTKDERPFFLSTPLLAKSPGSVDLAAPFGHPIWDILFSRQPVSTAKLIEQVTPWLCDPTRDLPALLEMFETPRALAAAARPARGSARVRYFGHACVLFEDAGTSVLVDPLISYTGESDVDRFTFDDLPERIDYVLITHAHVDHFVLETLLQLRHRIGCVVVGRAGGGTLPDISLKLALQHCGFANVVELGEHEELHFDNGFIVGAPFHGEHADLDIRAKLAYGVKLGDAGCAFLADSNPPHPECYAHLKSVLGHLDCLFIGMECVGAPASWSYGPILLKPLTRDEDQSRRLDGSDSGTAIQLQDYLMPDRTFVYAMGAEPWVTHLSSIVYSEDLPQFQHARRFEGAAQDNGRHARVLCGKEEIMLAN